MFTPRRWAPRGGPALRGDGRDLLPLHDPAPPDPVEDVHVGQVHRAEHQQHHTHLGRQGLEDAACVLDGVVAAQVEGDEAEVDEVEADHQEVVDGVGELLVALEHVGEEDPSVAAEGPGHPDGQSDADDQVDDVGDDRTVHVPHPFLNAFKTLSWTTVALVLNTFN